MVNAAELSTAFIHRNGQWEEHNCDWQLTLMNYSWPLRVAWWHAYAWAGGAKVNQPIAIGLSEKNCQSKTKTQVWDDPYWERYNCLHIGQISARLSGTISKLDWSVPQTLHMHRWFYVYI